MKTTKLRSRIAARGGAYSMAVTAVVIAILVAVNVFSSVLPASVTKYDISATQLYSITSSTKVVVNALEKDVTVYWVVQSDEEDAVISNLLDRYESLSSHITVVKKNPDVYPTFTSDYTSATVPNNSLIVECGDKSRYISYNDIYLTDIDYNTYSYVHSFDGEGLLTSAIDYVVSEELPLVYLLEGHGEESLPEAVQDQLEKENIELSSFSLLTSDGVPEDADAVMIYAPSSDVSEEEAGLLQDYLDDGGKMMVMAGPTQNGMLSNLYSVLESYGVETTEGLLLDMDRSHYAFGYPYVLLPDIASDEITDPLINDGYYVIFPLAQGLKVTGSSATALMTTSDAAINKADGYQFSSYEVEEGDTEGSFAVAVSVDTGNDGQLIWFASGQFLEELYNSYSSGANLNLAMNALSSLVGQRESSSIRSKSLDYNYLTISESDATRLKTWMIGILPGAFVLYGVMTAVERRRKRRA